MGLRVEQHNLEDLLKYFLARNEFSRENLIEVLQDLTSQERVKLNITNYAEFYQYYQFLYQVLKQDIIEGVSSTIVNSINMIGRSSYDNEFLERYPFRYILNQRINAAVKRDYEFTFYDGAWHDYLGLSSNDPSLYGVKVSLVDDAVPPMLGDKLIVSYTPFDREAKQYEEAEIRIVRGKERLKDATVDAAVFGKIVKQLSKPYYEDFHTKEQLFQKIIDTNPEDDGTVTKLITTNYDILNNSESKCKLEDLFTFKGSFYYTSDEDYPGLSQKTMDVIVLAGLRKILDQRSIIYQESDYLQDVIKDQATEIINDYNLKIKTLMDLVLATNPITEQYVDNSVTNIFQTDTTGFEETFRTIQSDIVSLKAYINEYVENNSMSTGGNYFMKNGLANYSGYYQTTIIPHRTGLRPTTVIINNVNPNSNEKAATIGDVYVRTDKQNIYVTNTGTSRSEFEFTIMFDTGELLEFPKDKTFQEFVESCINGIFKLTVDSSLIRINEDGQAEIELASIPGYKPSLKNYDFFIITNHETGKSDYYRLNDERLFKIDDTNSILTVITNKIEINVNDAFSITAMDIQSDPIMFLLKELMMNPTYYVQKISDFQTSILDVTNELAKKFDTVLGNGATSTLLSQGAKFVDLTSYALNKDDILFINGLAYSMVDTVNFNFFTTMSDIGIDRRILIVKGIELDDQDDIYVSRFTSLVDPFEVNVDNPEDINSPFNDYKFDEYIYITKNTSIGNGTFKSHEIPSDKVADSNIFYLDPASRMENEEPLDNRIEDVDLSFVNTSVTKDYDEDTQTMTQTRYAVVSHKLGVKPNFVNIMPYTTNIDKEKELFVGNIWWDADEENLYVYNDGDSMCEFRWYAAKDPNFVELDLGYGQEVNEFNKEDVLFYNTTHTLNNKVGYYGKDYLMYNSDENLVVPYNSNKNNKPYSTHLTYILGKSTGCKRFLEYATNFKQNVDGYFDKEKDAMPTGRSLLNYSGHMRVTRMDSFGGYSNAQYLPVNKFDLIETGDMVSFVDGVCRSVYANDTTRHCVIGVVVDPDEVSYISNIYETNKVPVATNGIHKVKVISPVSAGDRLYIDYRGYVGAFSTGIYIGKALDNFNNEQNTFKRINVRLDIE